MKDDRFIELSEDNIIAEGAYCVCYENPNSLKECVKIPKSEKKAEKRLRSDLAYYRKLHKRGVEIDYVADYLGECETSLGRGYRYECVRDADMKVSRTLEHYINTLDEDKNSLYAKLHELAVYLLENRMLISDIHLKNILVQIDSVGEMKPIIVDGIGDRVAITFLNIIPSFLDAKITRRWNRFAKSQLDGNAMLYHSANQKRR